MTSPKQIALVHLAAKQLGLDEGSYRAVLARQGGVTSARDLDHAGFAAVMAYFTACGFRSTWTRRTYGNRPGMATPGQIDLIRRLWRQYAGSNDDRALDRWLERSFKASALRFVTRDQAAKAISGLKAMIRRQPAQQETSA